VKTKNVAVSALVGLLTLALWYNFFLKPSRSETTKVKAETEVERDKLRPLQAQVAQAKADAADEGTFKARLAKLQRAVPDGPELADFIRDANTAAVASNLVWVSTTHGPPTLGVGGVAAINLGIQVKGTYEATLTYLDKIAALKRLVVIDSVQFSAAASGAEAGVVGASTGPFSGASELTIVITARMFETPEALAAAGTGTTTPPV
jgi:Tfp pilus assembly protein PilO